MWGHPSDAARRQNELDRRAIAAAMILHLTLLLLMLSPPKPIATPATSPAIPVDLTRLRFDPDAGGGTGAEHDNASGPNDADIGALEVASQRARRPETIQLPHLAKLTRHLPAPAPIRTVPMPMAPAIPVGPMVATSAGDSPAAEPDTPHTPMAGAPTGGGADATIGAAGSEGGAGGGSGGGIGAGVNPGDDYLTRLLRHLNRHKRCTAAATAREAAAASLVVAFTIRRDGAIGNALIEQSSGVSEIDDVALDMLRRASPAPALPRDYPGDQARVALPMKIECGWLW